MSLFHTSQSQIAPTEAVLEDASMTDNAEPKDGSVAKTNLVGLVCNLWNCSVSFEYSPQSQLSQVSSKIQGNQKRPCYEPLVFEYS